MFGASKGFGAPPAAGGFGAPPAGGFGAPPAGGFGGPAAAGGFGAPPAAGGFGGPAASKGFGAPPAGGFGAPPAAGGFGAPQQQASGQITAAQIAEAEEKAGVLGPGYCSRTKPHWSLNLDLTSLYDEAPFETLPQPLQQFLAEIHAFQKKQRKELIELNVLVSELESEISPPSGTKNGERAIRVTADPTPTNSNDNCRKSMAHLEKRLNKMTRGSGKSLESNLVECREWGARTNRFSTHISALHSNLNRYEREVWESMRMRGPDYWKNGRNHSEGPSRYFEEVVLRIGCQMESLDASLREIEAAIMPSSGRGDNSVIHPNESPWPNVISGGIIPRDLPNISGFGNGAAVSNPPVINPPSFFGSTTMGSQCASHQQISHLPALSNPFDISYLFGVPSEDLGPNSMRPVHYSDNRSISPPAGKYLERDNRRRYYMNTNNPSFYTDTVSNGGSATGTTQSIIGVPQAGLFGVSSRQNGDRGLCSDMGNVYQGCATVVPIDAQDPVPAMNNELAAIVQLASRVAGIHSNANEVRELFAREYGATEAHRVLSLSLSGRTNTVIIADLLKGKQGTYYYDFEDRHRSSFNNQSIDGVAYDHSNLGSAMEGTSLLSSLTTGANTGNVLQFRDSSNPSRSNTNNKIMHYDPDIARKQAMKKAAGVPSSTATSTGAGFGAPAPTAVASDGKTLAAGGTSISAVDVKTPATTTGFGAAPAATTTGFGAAPAATTTGFGAAPAATTTGFGAAPAATTTGFGGSFGSSGQKKNRGE